MTLDAIEAAAWADLYDAAPRSLARALALHHEAIAGAVVFHARLPTGLFNRTIVSGSPTDAALAATAPGAFLQVAPVNLDDGARARLAAAGFARKSTWVKLTRPAGPPVPDSGSIRVVEADAALADTFSRTLCAGFEMPELLVPWHAALVGRPGWQCYLAYDGAEPIATAALFTAKDQSWLGAASTIPALRRRGGQRALIARRVADATARGSSLLVCETGLPDPDADENPSLRNLLAAGFTVAYERENLVRMA